MRPVTVRRPRQNTQPLRIVRKLAKLGDVKTEERLKARSPNDDTSGIIMTRSSMQALTNLHFGGTGLLL